MVFASLVFLYGFLPVALCAYFAFPRPAFRNWVLIVCSLFFYAWGEPVWVLLLIGTGIVDYINGRVIDSFHGKWQAKAALIWCIVFNLGLLGFFKYAGFAADNIGALIGIKIPVPSNHLPIGISFYCFKTISYIVDVYRGEVVAQRSFTKFLLYVSNFPELVAGPIIRYADVADHIENRKLSWENFGIGIDRFAVGLAKKVIIANVAGEIAREFLEGSSARMSVLGAWWGILFFTIQIYFDFSGYSDMAIGLGRMFGFHYKENFNYPYVATSATDFWRRWHMSLGGFFRDYVYIPLGGNRKRFVFNIAIVWFLTGLWHGASWNFVLWGLMYGLLILIERGLSALTGRSAPRPIAHLYLILITLIGWTFFYFTDFHKVMAHLSAMFGLSHLTIVDPILEISFTGNAIFIAIALISCLPVWPFLKNLLEKKNQDQILRAWNTFARPAINLSLIFISTCLLIDKSYNPFLYFRF